ncbi:MAG: tripartite tricarboxylate transporter substrate binding protein [Burkholderiales bacterium]|nr:tripartite tricarboxylate transporter substrate binding protein [Burkholderiales bacterium]
MELSARTELRRSLVMTCVACGLAAAHPAPAQQGYPNRPIRFVVPSATGGSNDISARLFGQKLSEAFGQQVVIDNRAGAGSIIGTDLVAKSSPDGYTLLVQSSEITIITALHKKLPFDTVKDLAPVTLLATFPLLLVVHPGVEAKSVKELIALAKAKPGQLRYASNGNGTISHASAEMFKSMTGINLVHVPYKGAAPALTSILGGETAMGFYTTSATLQHIKAGRFRGLATSGEKRVASLPDLPTFAEAGLPGFVDARTWAGVFVRAGTPQPIIARLHSELTRIIRLPDVRERFVTYDWEAVGNTPEEFASSVRKEIATWTKVIREANIRAD